MSATLVVSATLIILSAQLQAGHQFQKLRRQMEGKGMLSLALHLLGYRTRP
ncbi:MAG TPA: hypothetical protein IGS37_17290 [Synechococcales cyanobacterium M55_K2018_004]|nr:hypothetical protein [Synechococcales cyanobacterium M55_K2018_004]